jgi:hypothetical protein
VSASTPEVPSSAFNNSSKEATSRSGESTPASLNSATSTRRYALEPPISSEAPRQEPDRRPADGHEAAELDHIARRLPDQQVSSPDLLRRVEALDAAHELDRDTQQPSDDRLLEPGPADRER